MASAVISAHGHAVNTLCVILGRAGSKGLPGKNALPLAGRPMIAWSLDHALAAQRAGHVQRVIVSTDGPDIAAVARSMGVPVIERPADLAGDAAAVDAAARHAVEQAEARDGHRCDAVVILYANVPVRPVDLIARAVAKLADTGCDSVQSVCPVGKAHPYWMRTLSGDGGDVIGQYQPNEVHRRQDLPPAYQLDGGIIAVRRASLFRVAPGRPHAFLGADQRAVVTEPGSVVDVDAAADLPVAEATLLAQRDARPVLHIGDRPVGREHPVYVIAELGVNHDGRLDRALQLLDAAAVAGADAVKLQYFRTDELLSADAQLAVYQREHAVDAVDAIDAAALLRGLELSDAHFAAVRDAARQRGLHFVVTCFSVDAAPRLLPLDVDAVKLASPDCVNTPLLDAVADLHKPLLLSTGAADAAEVSAVAAWLSHRSLPAALLHCVSSYPTDAADAALGAIAALPPGYVRGYSDHTTAIDTGMLAVAAGACILEKHLTYDRGAAGPDHAASLEPGQLREYIRAVRRAESMRGVGIKRVLDCEEDVRRVSRQSLAARRDLKAGAMIHRDDLTIQRPGTGLPAAWLDRVVGRPLSRDVQAGRLLRDGDVVL
jgi:N,N'-diacetyllegionaminate synthase